MTIVKYITLLILIVAAVAVPVYAQPNTFRGTQGTSWHIPGNWTFGVVPTPSQDVLIPTGLTCIISTDNGVALTVTVASTSTLGIEEGFQLTLHGTVEDQETAITVQPSGTIYLVDDVLGNRSSIIFRAPNNNTHNFDIAGGGTITAELAAGYGGGLLTDPVGFVTVINMLDGVTLTGSLQFESLGIENAGTMLVTGNDEMDIGAALGIVSVLGDGKFTVTGPNAVMSFTDTAFVVDGPISVTDGLLEFPDSGLVVFSNTLRIDGGTLSVNAGLLCRSTDTDVLGGGSVDVGLELDLDASNIPPSTLTLTAGTVAATGDLLLDETTVAVSGGTLSAANVDATDSAITVSGGAFGVSGTLATQRVLGTMSVTVSGGALDMNLFDLIHFTTLTVSSGTLDAASVNSANSTITVSGGTVTVTGVFNTESTFWPNSVTISAGELELNGAYTGGGVSLGTGFTVCGGTLDVKAAFSNTGSLSFSGGTIAVAASTVATFAELP